MLAPEGPSPPPTFTRAGRRRVRLTCKVRYQLLEGSNMVSESQAEQSSSAARVLRVHLLLTEHIKTAPNHFGVSRLYKRRPCTSCESPLKVKTVYTPTTSQRVASKTARTIAAIVAPFPNLSSFLFGQQSWLRSNTKSLADIATL